MSSRFFHLMKAKVNCQLENQTMLESQSDNRIAAGATDLWMTFVFFSRKRCIIFQTSDCGYRLVSSLKELAIFFGNRCSYLDCEDKCFGFEHHFVIYQRISNNLPIASKSGLSSFEVTNAHRLDEINTTHSVLSALRSQASPHHL